MVAAILHLDEGARALGEAGDEMRRGLAHRHDVGDADALPQSPCPKRIALDGVPESNFSRLPSTRVTSGIAANVSGSIWAAQPVTKIRASGRARLRLADRLAGLAHRLVGDRAAVDDDEIVLAARQQRASPRSRRC